jgi:peptidyl-prolyl cis-trans isomerase A (cyclophilin A)
MRLIFTLLDLPPLNQFDAAASLPLDFFTPVPDLSPYTARMADPRLFDPNAAFKPFDRRFDWHGLAASPVMDDPEEMRRDYALMGQSADRSALLDPNAPEMNRRAPATYQVRLDTSQGAVLIEVHRDWAPRGADRFYNLVRHGFYDDARFFRVVAGAWAQFGIPADPTIAQAWRQARFPDDPVRQPNHRGTVAYAMAGPNDRTTQVYINLRDNAGRLDSQGFAPFGRVVGGMDVVDRLYSGYGEESGGGIRRGRQDPVFEGGNAWLAAHFPKLDYIRTARVVER